MFKRELDLMVLLKDTKERDKIFNRYDQYQRVYYQSILDKSFVYCNAICGTGKTLIGFHALINMLSEEKIQRIIYVRFPSDRDRKQGFLPGTLEDKCRTMWTPVYDALITLGIQPEHIDIMRADDTLRLTSDIGLRGVNLENCGVIIDEAQNGTYDDIKLVLTRLHDNCTCVYCGDSKQLDNKRQDSSFERFGEYMSEPSWGSKVTLETDYRGKMSRRAESMPREVQV
jgi:Phosphate starvation-inducible protein PhoH, predicted ATPase